MEDIFLDDPRQTSAQDISRKQKEKKKKNGRRFREYLVDFFIKSLLLAALLSLDFTLFAEAGSYNLFTTEQTLSPEATLIYEGIIAFSFILIFLFSFSQTLQNLIVGLGSSFLLLALFGQFALFDSHSILLSYIPTAPTGTISKILSNYSHLVLAVTALLFVFIFLSFAKRSTQTYLLGILLLVIGGLMSEAYFNPKSRIFDTKASLGDERALAQNRNIVFIALQNSPSFYQLSNFDEPKKIPEIQQASNNLLGFYLQNNFTYYPYAYIRHNNNPYLNMVSHLNPDMEGSPEQLLLSDVIMNSYWDFKNVGHSKLYLKDNHFFNTLIKENYNIRVYEGEGIELCSINSRLSVNRCISRTGLPIDLDSLDINMPQKAALLAAQWLESTGFTNSIDPILGITSAFTREVSPLRFSTSQLKTYGAFKNLNLIAQDISTDKGNNAYITIIDMPGDLFIYDNLCNLKPISRWISAKNQSISLQERRKAFAEQTNCLYGQLEKFIQTLERNGSLKRTTLIIQGLSTPFSSIPGMEKDFFKNLQNTKQTGMAIYDPLKNQADIDYRLCTIPGIFDAYLNQQECKELEGFTLTEQLKAKLFQEAKKQELSNKRIEEAKTSFKQWYNTWAAYHQIENNQSKEIIPLEKSTDTPEISPEREIKEAPIAKQVEELAPEAKVKTLDEVEEQTTVSQEVTTKPQAAPKEETPKADKATATIQKQDIENKQVEKAKETIKEDVTEKASKASQAPEEQPQPVKEGTKASVSEKKTEQTQSAKPQKKETSKQNVAEQKPLPKPEQLKQEFKNKQAASQEKTTSVKENGEATISVEVKVIERSTSNDVIPPALIDDVKEAPQPQK